ncbi:MAG: hypothetical protein VX893_02660, partial [Candidatus Latescibacterota bacterium]|nr:hypothetical protein [Candidatus Latescibacterota bacterium]
QLGKGFRGGRRQIKEAGADCVFEGFFLQSPVVMASPRADYEGRKVSVYVISHCKNWNLKVCIRILIKGESVKY